jgi:hypothetical protein
MSDKFFTTQEIRKNESSTGSVDRGVWPGGIAVTLRPRKENGEE